MKHKSFPIVAVEDRCYTFIKPSSGDYANQVIVVYEDAHGQMDLTIQTLEELEPNPDLKPYIKDIQRTFSLTRGVAKKPMNVFKMNAKDAEWIATRLSNYIGGSKSGSEIYQHLINIPTREGLHEYLEDYADMNDPWISIVLDLLLEADQ